MRKLFVTTVLLSLFWTPKVSAQKVQDLPEYKLQKSEVESHMRFLASDELLGRKTGDQGNLVAARYLAEQFRKLGLQPVPGSNSYFQEVPFQRSSSPGKGNIKIGEQNLPSTGGEWLLVSGKKTELNAPIVYAAFGFEEDYANLDVKGKIVLVQSGGSEVQNPSQTIASSVEKRKVAKAKGALAVVEIFNITSPWQFISNYFSQERISLDDTQVDENPFTHIWIDGKNEKITRLFRDANQMEFATEGRNVTKFIGYNIAAYLPGSDPKLKDEYVLLSAHYDHIGYGSSTDPQFADGDTIFNGARDNAFGCVGLLATAQSLMIKKTKRSIMFLALTGEELGLLGSRHYAANPLMPLNKCIFNLNCDGAGYNDTKLVGVIGLERTGAKEEIVKACKAFGLEVVGDPAPEQNLFDRSDNVNFALKGIPAPTFTPGFRDFNEEIMKYYHKAADNPDSIDYDYLLNYSKAYVYAVRLIADRKVAPKWIQGDKYEEASQKLYGSK